MGKHFSNKHFSKKRRRNVRSFETAEIIEFQHSKFEIERSLPPLLPLNPTQAAYIDALRTTAQVVVLGVERRVLDDDRLSGLQDVEPCEGLVGGST